MNQKFYELPKEKQDRTRSAGEVPRNAGTFIFTAIFAEGLL